jgi:P4 family phage/plasmid primase-like protien
VNHELRSRIGKAEYGDANVIGPPQWFNERFPALSANFGDAVQIGKSKGGTLFAQDIGEDFIAATLNEQSRPETPTVFAPTERKFYSYVPREGIYVHQREPVLVTGLSRLLLDCARDCERGPIDTRPLQFRLRASQKLAGVLKKAQAVLAVPDDFFSTALTKFLPCGNGVLRLSDHTLLPFSPAYRRRNKLAVGFDADAKCPLFLDTLMRPALGTDEIDLLQRWCGLALIGVNLAQRFLILTGTAGGGKGTFIRVLVGIIGLANVASLRTQLLMERFEVGRFLGKTLLYGADVPEKFLNHRGASVLKALTGGDPMTMEMKNSNESPLVSGQFNAIVTCNSRLTVHLEGDSDAWRRRLAIVNYGRPKPSEVIADLDQKILGAESSGVLNWALKGLEKIRTDGWQLHLTAAQQKVVDDLLLESESHIIFAQEALVPVSGHQLTVGDCYGAYIRFCTLRGWISLPRNKFANLMEDTVARMYRVTLRHDVSLNALSSDQRGWIGIQVKELEI